MVDELCGAYDSHHHLNNDCAHSIARSLPHGDREKHTYVHGNARTRANRDRRSAHSNARRNAHSEA